MGQASIARACVTAVLLLFVATTLGWIVAEELSPNHEHVDIGVDEASVLPCVVDAMYFHNTARCPTCRNIESTAQAVISEEFAAELESGRLRWRTVNMEDELEYVDRYHLTMPTLILVRMVDGQEAEWMALDETWNLIGSRTRFVLYVGDTVRSFLGDCP